MNQRGDSPELERFRAALDEAEAEIPIIAACDRFGLDQTIRAEVLADHRRVDPEMLPGILDSILDGARVVEAQHGNDWTDEREQHYRDQAHEVYVQGLRQLRGLVDGMIPGGMDNLRPAD